MGDPPVFNCETVFLHPGIVFNTYELKEPDIKEWQLCLVGEELPKGHLCIEPKEAIGSLTALLGWWSL